MRPDHESFLLAVGGRKTKLDATALCELALAGHVDSNHLVTLAVPWASAYLDTCRRLNRFSSMTPPMLGCRFVTALRLAGGSQWLAPGSGTHRDVRRDRRRRRVG